MSATLAPGRAPRTDKQWVEGSEKRIRTLEQPTSQRVGSWVMNDVDGMLVASNDITGDRVSLSGMADVADGLGIGMRGYVTPDEAKKVAEKEAEKASDKGVLGVVRSITNTIDGTIDTLVEWASRVPVIGRLTGLIDGTVIPGLDASRIISGTFALDMIDDLLDTGQYIFTELIPGLDASKIISGQFAFDLLGALFDLGNKLLDDLIPGLDASKIISGQFAFDVLGNLFDLGGKILADLFPGFDASKIVSGVFGRSRVEGLNQIVDTLGGQPNATMSHLVSRQGEVYQTFQALAGVSFSPTTTAAYNMAQTVGVVRASKPFLDDYYVQNYLREEVVQHVAVAAGFNVTPVTPSISNIISKFASRFTGWFT